VTHRTNFNTFPYNFSLLALFFSFLFIVASLSFFLDFFAAILKGRMKETEKHCETLLQQWGEDPNALSIEEFLAEVGFFFEGIPPLLSLTSLKNPLR
jgi:hypothetical protein